MNNNMQDKEKGYMGCHLQNLSVDKIKLDNTKLDKEQSIEYGEDKQTDENQEGYNFMGTLHNWTTSNEQKRRIKEIEKVLEKDD